MKQKKVEIMIHGHRGCRGILPENTIEAFTQAVEMGVDVLEMDVVLTADDDILVSHDPFMQHEICLKPDGSPITESEELSLNIFRMTTADARSYPCGKKKHPRFPTQRPFPSHKPTLPEVSKFLRNFCRENNYEMPLLNIEIKSKPEWDNVFHPEPAAYVQKFINQFDTLKIDHITIIQSFDTRILEELHKQSPETKLVLLSEDKEKNPADKLSELSFHPYGYSPEYHLIDEATVQFCNEKNIKLIAWTINETFDMKRLMDMGVTHIITDYPQRALKILKREAPETVDSTQ